jgi:hypothetical protein
MSFLALIKKAKSIALKVAKGKSKISFDEETDDGDGIAMFNYQEFQKINEL